MKLFDRLQIETAGAREKFRALPVLQEALRDGISSELYVAYLGQAYHHVRHTCPLLGAAAGRCGRGDERLRDALFAYIDEEKGHEAWLLDDIRAIGSEADLARTLGREGDPAVRAMVGYMYYAIERISPYAMLGMVFVLESTSTEIASQAATAIACRIGVGTDRGFSYLLSHGTIDHEHIAFFGGIADSVESPELQAIVIDTANMIYRLWGAMFADLVGDGRERRDAA